MLDELIVGGILLGALALNSNEWDDDVGKRFHEELDAFIKQGKESVSEMSSHPIQNATDLRISIEQKEEELSDTLAQMRDGIYQIKERIKSISI